jgi:hypothetical protein
MSTVLSGRARSAVMRHQHQLATCTHSLRRLDRVLAGTLVACDPGTQHEMLASYFEALQELRVSIQRLESFLDVRLARAFPGALAERAATPPSG